MRRKAPKLSYQALHSGNNKQNVALTLAFFHDTTIAAAKVIIQIEKMFLDFKLIHTWWTICNSKQRYSANPLGNVIVSNDNKTNLSQEWSTSPYFTLTPKTSSALINTLRSQAMLIDELLNDGYDYILTARLQSDPIGRRFSQYRQMSGGRFLVSLREVRNTERILSCRSLIKNDINFWKEDLQQPESSEDESYEMVDEMLRDQTQEILESVLDDDSSDVATIISGYIAKKLLKRPKCKD